ncbi:hypothetical protein SLS55_005781 [Diplodia seriata]|uniref:BTB domain-containing protein n=1 Tax=Diplodia seriata TaxID=420778 RepID=A0ABR3CHB9_9PEZI
MTSPPELKRPSEAHESSERQPKRPTFDDDRKHPVDVRVGSGPDTERFHCFAPLLRRYSRYFKKELGDRKDDVGPDDLPGYPIPVLSLTTEKPADFSLFRAYMENPRFFCSAAEVRKKKTTELARLFCFAHRMGALKLQNDCIDCLHLKARQSALRLSSPGKNNHEEPVVDTVFTWKRTARWVLNHPDINPKRCGLYVFLQDFFAFFVLQVMPSLNEGVISDLPNSFLWDILCALESALARHVPGLPALTTDRSTAKSATGLTTFTMVNGKEVPVVHIEDIDEEKDTLSVPINSEVDTKPTAVPEEEAALKVLPKSSLISKVILLAGILRAITDGTLAQPQPSKKRETPAKKKSTKKNEDCDDDGSDDDSETVTFFGVSNLCKYHVHTTAEMRDRCEQKFEAAHAEEVWPVVPLRGK